MLYFFPQADAYAPPAIVFILIPQSGVENIITHHVMLKHYYSFKELLFIPSLPLLLLLLLKNEEGSLVTVIVALLMLSGFFLPFEYPGKWIRMSHPE